MGRKNKNRWGFAGLVVGILMAALPLFAKDIVIPSGQSLLIGTMDEPRFVSIRSGVDLAVDQLGNQLLGFPIRTKHLGHGCDPSQNRNIAQGLAKDPKVLGMVGPICSRRADSILRALSDGELLTISPANTGAFLTDPEIRVPYYFRTASNDNFQGALGGRFAREGLGAATAVIFFYPDDDFTDTLRNGFNQAFTDLGGTVVKEISVPFPEEDLNSVLAAIAQADVVYGALFVEDFSSLYELVRNQQAPVGEIPLIGSDGIFEPFLFELIGTDPQEVYASSQDGVGPNFPAFLQDFLAAFGVDPGPYDALAYDATQLMLRAAEAVGQVDSKGNLRISSQALLDFMNDPGNYPYLGAGGLYQAPIHGDLNPDGFQMFKAQNGEFFPIFP